MSGTTNRRAGLLFVVLALAFQVGTGAIALSWSPPVLVDRHGHLTEVTCPSTRLCIAIDQAGRVVTSRNPTGGRRARSRPTSVDKNGLDGLPNALSCPSERLCVGVDNNSEVVISTNPAGGKRAWSTRVNIDSNAWTTGISCPSARLCVAVDAGLSGGAVLVSTNPRRGRGVWSRRVPVDGIVLDKVACPSTTLCVASDPLGYGVVSRHPAGSRRAWSSLFPLDPFAASTPPPPADSEAEVDANGNIVTSTNPAVGSKAWRAAVHMYPGPLHGVSCPSSRLCVAVGDGGSIVTSTAPTAPYATWTAPRKIAPSSLTGIACPSTRLCVAIDARGEIIAGHD